MKRIELPGTAGEVALEALERIVHAALQPAVNAAMRVMAERHHSVFERLADFRGANLLIEPTDQPISFLLTVGPPHRLVLAAPHLRMDSTASIRGPFKSLIGLLEGRFDADALLFSRELSISGSTELAVAVRNAIDGQDIDLARDFSEAAGVPAGPARYAIASGMRLIETIGPAITSIVRQLRTQSEKHHANPAQRRRRRAF